MNGPHVVALICQIEHGDTIDYSRAESLEKEEAGFRLTLQDRRVRFEFQDHYATEEEAQQAIAEYIRVWEFDACLEHGPDYFRLKFIKSDIEDRKPTPGVISVRGRLTGRDSISKARLVVCPRTYPAPPSDISLDSNVEMMYLRYMEYRRKRGKLTETAYLCLTALQNLTRRSVAANKTKPKVGDMRKRAAAKYNISAGVFNEVGRLFSAKEGPMEPRKKAASDPALTLKPEERDFLERALERLIRRVAERAHDPNKNLPQISLSDLPSICKP